MIAISTLVGVVVVGLVVWTLTVEQSADFGVTGLRYDRSNCRIVLAQAALVAAAGFVLGAAIAYGAQFLIQVSGWATSRWLASRRRCGRDGRRHREA